MNCPICNVPLLIADRVGVEIDYCPKCRGVWLDRGELEKIIERSNNYMASAPQAGYRVDIDDDDDHHKRQYAKDDHHGFGHRDQHGRKKSIWNELFDF